MTTKTVTIAMLFAAILTPILSAAGPDILINDFESDTPANDRAAVPPRPREGVPPFERTRDIAITGTYLLVPIKNGGVPPFRGPDRATMQILDVFVGDTLVHSPNVYLAHRAAVAVRPAPHP